MRNRSNYEKLVRLRVGEPLSSGEIFTALNDAYVDIASRVFCVEKKTTLTTTAGSPFVPFAGHVLEIEGLMKVLPTFRDPGWCQWGGNIVINPTPESAYSLTVFYSDYPSVKMKQRDVFYNANGVNFIDTVGVSWIDYDYPAELPVEFYSCIVDFASYVLSWKFKDWGKAGTFYNQYLQNLENSRTEYMTRKADQRVSV